MLPGELDGRRFLRALARFGWVVVRQRGSHRTLAKPGVDRVIVVAFHKRVPRNTVRQTLRRACIDEAVFLDAY